MEEKRILKWMFEAPDDVIWPEEFENWEIEQLKKEIEADSELRNITLSEEKSLELYNKIMEKVQKNI